MFKKEIFGKTNIKSSERRAKILVFLFIFLIIIIILFLSSKIVIELKDVTYLSGILKNKQKEIFESQTGSAQPHIYPKHIAELKVNIPSKKSIQEFSLIITPFFEHISKNLFENDKLSNIRNAILPKLISGNIDISNI